MFWMARNWWVLMVRGVLSVAFGVLALAWPGDTVGFLLLFFGAYAFVDGLFAIGAALTYYHNRRHWWALMAEGLLGVGLGMITLISPAAVAVASVVLIGVWAIATGILELVAALQLRSHIDNEIWLGLSGIVSMVFGVVLLAQPGAGLLALVWIIGGYAILFGCLLIVLSLRVRNWGLRHRHPAGV